jgi:epoxyqueuosine reductase
MADMDYMAAHGLKRARPAELVPGTVSVITARMDYLPRLAPGAPGSGLPDDWQAVERRGWRAREGVVSVYARGRDYHKVLRAAAAEAAGPHGRGEVGPFGHRVFTDSAPVLEAELAARSGQGWRGKHTLVLSREAGSMFFPGRDLRRPGPAAQRTRAAHCGSCRPASTSAPRRPSSRPTGWMRGAASPT